MWAGHNITSYILLLTFCNSSERSPVICLRDTPQINVTGEIDI